MVSSCGSITHHTISPPPPEEADSGEASQGRKALKCYYIDLISNADILYDINLKDKNNLSTEFRLKTSNLNYEFKEWLRGLIENIYIKNRYIYICAGAPV